MKIIIVYSSKTGFTKKYADWIAEELKCKTLPYSDFSESIINEYDIIIFGSRVHAGKIEHLDKMKSYFNDKPGKELIVFATGGTPNAAEEVVNKIWRNNLTESEINDIPHFYMQSGLDYKKMGFPDKAIMKMGAFFMSMKKNKNDNEAGYENAIKDSYDDSSKEYILPLIKYMAERTSLKQNTT
ncbi:MAG: flavodoxin domain-containing protein [Oscillospiraceae bacterium]|nr:flavodoxin domain-containing protein [Oscillospiraceae bacterium]